MYALAQGDIVQNLGNASQWGIAGAMLILTIGFVRYLQVKEAADREERKTLSADYHRVIDNLAAKVESLGTTLTTAFAAEMAAERIEHRTDIEQIGQLMHDIRGLAQQTASAKELSEALAKRAYEAEKTKGKP